MPQNFGRGHPRQAHGLRESSGKPEPHDQFACARFEMDPRRTAPRGLVEDFPNMPEARRVPAFDGGSSAPACASVSASRSIGSLSCRGFDLGQPRYIPVAVR